MVWHPQWDRLPYCTAQLVPAVCIACLIEGWPLQRWPVNNSRPGFLRVMQVSCVAQCMVLALYPFGTSVKTESLALYVAGAVLVVAAAATCIELGFAKAKSSDDKTAASALRPYNAASAMAVLLTFSAIGAFVQLGLGYLEAHFNLLLYGEVGAYYGWNVGALLLLAVLSVWLSKKGSVSHAKFVAVLAGFTFAITCILRQVSSGSYSIYSQQSSWLTIILQVFILELGHLHTQGLWSWTRWALPTSETPPAVYHPHGSATGAFPGVAATSVDAEHQKAERIGSMTGMVIGGANKDEILDAFDVFRSSSLDKLYGLHCGPILRKGQEPGEQIYRLPFQSGEADRKWSEFVKDLAPSIECMSNTGIPGKNSRAPVPGSKLFSTFQASEAQRGSASHFTELGGLLMHTQHGSSTAFGTCNVMVSSQTLRTQARPEATEEILFKLTNGYNKGLWPVLHLDEPSDHLVMPSDAADHASRKYLGGCLQQASSTLSSGEGASLLPGTDTRGSAMWQKNSSLVSLIQQLARLVDSGKMATVICPRPALVSEMYMGTRMRLWGAISQGVAVADSGNKASQGSGPVDFVFYVDEKCEHVAEVLVHAWLDLHECSIEACLAGELLVGHASADHAAVPGRVHQEIEETKPVDLLQALGRLAANQAGAGLVSAPSRQASSSLFKQSSAMSPRRPVIQDASATKSSAVESLAVRRQYADKQSDQTVQQALAEVLADALQHRCFDYSIDTAWLSATHDSWRTIMSTAIHKNSMSRRLPAGPNASQNGAQNDARRAGVEAAPKTTTQVLNVSEVVDRVCAWMQQTQCCTAGTLSVLRQVQRCSLELTLHSLLHAAVGLSEHGPKEFLSDSNIMVVYLEHMGIGNECENWYGMTKFRLGRILWNRYQDMRCDGDSLVDALPPGKGIYDLEQDDVEKMEAPIRDEQHDTVMDNMTGFATAIGNGVFWLIPFVMYFVPLTLVGFSLYDNGNLSTDLRRWLFWSFFCAFLVVGGYFNLLLHFINNHRWRFSGQAQLLAIAQSIPSALFVFLVCAIPVGAYARLRSGWLEAIFSGAAFVFLSLELTMLMIVGSLTTDGNLWGSRSALRVIGVYVAQLGWNAASRYITKDWGEDVVVNLVGLLVFAMVAGLMLIIQIRSHAQIWAEALQSGEVTDAKTISKPALQVLLSFHNAMYGKHETPDTLPGDELALIARKAAQTLLTKTKVLRRQRLSIIFDKYCWVVPQGALMHMMITIPYWFGEWGGEGLLKDIYSNVLVMSLAYVISAGAFCEWCWIARQASLGLNHAQKRAMYIRTLGQLIWWCILMAIICTAFLLLLMATPTWIDPTFGLDKVYKNEASEMYWFYLKLAGYTMMVFVRFDDIMGDTEPVARIDALHMFVSLVAAVACTVPLAKLKSFDAAPPTAVIVAGGVYLALHLARKWTRQIKQARKDRKPEVEVYQLPLSSLIGQPAFSNSTFRQTDLRSALHRLQATKSKFRHKLKPDHKAGQEVVKLLQAWSESERPGHIQYNVNMDKLTEDKKVKEKVKAAMTPAKDDDALAVVDPTKEEEVKAPAVPPSTKHLLNDAYPDMVSIASTALDFWMKGKTEVWIVPFAALNTDVGAPQLYSLGVPHPDSELLAVHVVVSDAEWHQIEAEGGEAASRRVAEALLFATSMTMLKATGQTSSMTLSRMDACMWENPESAGSLQQRLADELAELPPSVLSSMADRGPLALMSAIWQQLMGQYSAVGDTTWKDTDLFADMGPTAVEDAWQWLPLQARLTLVHFLGHLPQLAGQLSNSNPESRAKLDDALQQLLEGAELTSAQRNALKMATELVVCGEEIESPAGMLADATVLKESSRPSDMPHSPTLLAAIRARPHFLASALAPAAAESSAETPTNGSPDAAADVPALPLSSTPELSSLDFVAHSNASSLPRRVLRAYLAVEMLLEVQQAVKKQMQGGGNSLIVSKSSTKAAPKAQKSHLALDVSAHAGTTKPGAGGALEVVPAAGDTEVVSLPGTTAGLSAQHKSGLVVADSIDAEFLAAQKAAHLTVRKAISFGMQSYWRLLWLALMGDASFWQEAMHLIDGRRNRFLHYMLLPVLVFWQIIAFASQAMYMYLCCYAIWDVGGVWSWLVVAQRKTIQAVARYDATGQVSHVLTITRQGFHHTYMSLVANSASQMQLQAPVNTTPALDLPTSKKVLDLARAVMGAGFDNNDSLYWCHTGAGMCVERPSGTSAISTAFVVRSSRSVAIKGVAKRTLLQSSGLQTVAYWLPVWQHSPEDKTSSVWIYETGTSTWPQQKLTWFGVGSLEDARHMLAGATEPNMITSYGSKGIVSAISTRFAAAKAEGAESRSLVGFHLKTKPRADEAAVRGAGCKIETMDDSGVQVTLQLDLHFFYPVTMVAGKASRVAYTPLTPDPEHPKALLLPFATQMHITVAGHEPAWQYLLVRTKPPGLLRKSNYLWPSNSQETIDCWYKTDAKSTWQKSVLPEWLSSALGALDVPWAPSVWQETPALPAHLKMKAASNSVQLHTLKAADTGLSRMLLWWSWKMGAASVNNVFYPTGTQAAASNLAQGLGAIKSLFQGGARPVLASSVPPVLDGLSATTMDESLLRGEPLLFWYWTAVGWLSYKECQAAIAARKSTLQVAIGSNLLESGNTFSQLAHNTSSLVSFNTVPGNAYTMVTPLLAQAGEADAAAQGDSAEDPDGSLHVVAVDSGTWPTDGGGVATCRELVLDYVQHVRWSVLSEIGNDFKQVQPGYVDHKTLDSVDLLIMWDGQYPTPAQNALAAVPYIDLSWRQYITRATTIKHKFVPVLDVFLMVLLKSSFLSAADVQAFSEAIMQMWRYFQIYDWERTWASPQVVRTFFAALNAFSRATVGEAATDGDLYGAYDAVQHYMKFICMPKLAACHMGSVCHASNHGTQAMTGMIFKKLFNQALIVWDHCVYVRERLLWYDTEKAMPFLVRDTLARLHRAAAEVLYAEADLVTPCCATFNVDWEQWLGHAPDTIMPVVNGLDFNTYKSVDRVLAERPTVVMMAHINPLKDIVTAIRAAKLIVEEYKVTDYQLLVYGNKRQDEVYCAKCERLIKKLGMQDHVFIMGLAKPAEILRQGWIYLQSSISEGLPISILEAGMSGLCVVCTDVGGCAETMSDGRRSFGRLTSARNHKMVAYGQMEVMAMLPTLSNPNLSQPPQVDPDALLARLTDPAIHEQRKMWGVEYKEFIKRKFSLFTHANQQRQAFYLTHYSRQIYAGDAVTGAASVAHQDTRVTEV